MSNSEIVGYVLLQIVIVLNMMISQVFGLVV